MSAGMDYSEFEQLAKNFKTLVKDYGQFLDGFLETEGNRLLADTKRNTPVDTSRLKNSWKLTGPLRRGNTRYVVVHTNVNYASWVEDGHRIVNQYGDTGLWQPGRHMARKALVNARLKLDRRFNTAFNKFCKSRGIGK